MRLFPPPHLRLSGSLDMCFLAGWSWSLLYNLCNSGYSGLCRDSVFLFAKERCLYDGCYRNWTNKTEYKANKIAVKWTSVSVRKAPKSWFLSNQNYYVCLWRSWWLVPIWLQFTSSWQHAGGEKPTFISRWLFGNRCLMFPNTFSSCDRNHELV